MSLASSLFYLYVFSSFIVGMYISESNYFNAITKLNKFEMDNIERIKQMGPLEREKLGDFRDEIAHRSMIKGFQMGFTFPCLFYLIAGKDQEMRDKMWKRILNIQKYEIYDHFNILK